MKLPKLEKILEDLNIEKIIKSSIKKNLPNVEEAYVSEPKPFPQVSETVSQYTKTAHEELYKGYVSEINKVSAELDTADREHSDPNHSTFRSLKLDETYNLNAKWLHELYFANAFDPHSQIYMDSIAFLKFQRDWGDFDTYQQDLIACAMSCGEGWAVTAYHMHLQRYVNTFISHHSSDVMVGLYPVLVLDCWSHAYYRDYLNDKRSFVMSQMREIKWEVIEERVKKAEAIHELLK